MADCMNCGHEVDARAKVCYSCGKTNPTSLSGLISFFKKRKEKNPKKRAKKNLRACPTCGKYISPRARKCPDYGEPF